MKTFRILVLLFAGLCIANNSFSQGKYLLYKTDFAYISTQEKPHIQAGYRHFVALNKKQGVELITKDKQPTTSESFKKLIFRDKNKYKEVPCIIEENHCFVEEKSPKKWTKIDSKNFSFSKGDITYTKQTKVINGYNCKLALIKNEDEITEIWFTKDIKYNWLFINHFRQIPGTIVLAKVQKTNFVLLELMQVKAVSDKTLINQGGILSMLINW